MPPHGHAFAVALAACLLLSSVAAAEPTPPQEKLAAARRTATWIVDKGEYLYAICRLLTGITSPRCATDVYAANPHAFFDGDPSRLVPGARLSIPAAYLGRPQDPASPGRAPPAPVAPAASPAPAASTPIPAPASAPAAAPPRPAPYRDALIGGAAPADDAATTAGAADAAAPGLRFISVEYSADLFDSGRGTAGDHALALQLRRETENWGEWALEAAGRQAHGNAGGPAGGPAAANRSGGRATLYQRGVPLTERLAADGALGVIRAPLNPLVTNSFRITLPSPLYAGVSTQVGDGARDFRLAAGEIGVLSGFNGAAFDATRGRFASAGANARLGEQWLAGIQSMHVDDVAGMPDHHSAALALVRELGNRAGKLSFHALADSRGQRGAWADADIVLDRTRHRFGAYHLDPGLLWSDAQLANDQRGAYWRADRRGVSQLLFGGLNVADSNLDRAPDRGGQKSVDGFAGISIRLDRTLSLGATLSLQAIDPHRATAARSRAGAGSAFISFARATGTTRLDLSRYLVRPGESAREYVDSVGLSQDWPALGGFAVSTAINLSREHALLDVTDRQSVSVALRGPVAGDFQWDAALALARIRNGRGTEQNVNASLSSYWQVTPAWQATLQLVWNTIDPAPPLAGAVTDPFRREKRVQFTLRYEEASGTPYAMLGTGRAGLLGTGRITGVVFFDENGDGVRQPNERGAAGLTVFLDARLVATTDAAGRFQFGSVPTGPHTLLVQADQLPLPWTLEDESGIRVTVPLRSDVVRDIPLTRLRP